ncbi:hypothetical protein ACSSS7_007954 [Eimeria intestinalis]
MPLSSGGTGDGDGEGDSTPSPSARISTLAAPSLPPRAVRTAADFPPRAPPSADSPASDSYAELIATQPLERADVAQSQAPVSEMQPPFLRSPSRRQVSSPSAPATAACVPAPELRDCADLSGPRCRWLLPAAVTPGGGRIWACAQHALEEGGRTVPRRAAPAPGARAAVPGY